MNPFQFKKTYLMIGESGEAIAQFNTGIFDESFCIENGFFCCDNENDYKGILAGSLRVIDGQVVNVEE